MISGVTCMAANDRKAVTCMPGGFYTSSGKDMWHGSATVRMPVAMLLHRSSLLGITCSLQQASQVLVCSSQGQSSTEAVYKPCTMPQCPTWWGSTSKPVGRRWRTGMRLGGVRSRCEDLLLLWWSRSRSRERERSRSRPCLLLRLLRWWRSCTCHGDAAMMLSSEAAGLAAVWRVCKNIHDGCAHDRGMDGSHRRRAASCQTCAVACGAARDLGID
jgi:hypothetical protein